MTSATDDTGVPTHPDARAALRARGASSASSPPWCSGGWTRSPACSRTASGRRLPGRARRRPVVRLVDLRRPHRHGHRRRTRRLAGPGHGGPDSATTELIAPPLRLAVLPSLILVTVLALAGGVSLGPENPIIAINTGLLVALVARLWPAVPPELDRADHGGRHDRRPLRHARGCRARLHRRRRGPQDRWRALGSPLPAARRRRRPGRSR